MRNRHARTLRWSVSLPDGPALALVAQGIERQFAELEVAGSNPAVGVCLTH